MGTAKAVFAAGCFWGVEAIFQEVAGVLDAVSGYCGGHVDNPGYREVCGGGTGHAEAVEVTYDPAIVSYEKLLNVFWNLHDPTTLNRQGPDVGTQYRSGIFVTSAAEEATAKSSLAEAQKAFTRPITTEVAPLDRFWPAEDYHQDYFAKHPGHASCHFVRGWVPETTTTPTPPTPLAPAGS